MAKELEFIIRDDNVYLLNENSQIIGLKQAVGIVSMSVYAGLVSMKEEQNSEKKEELKDQVIFQSNLLTSLANAFNAIK